MVADVLGDLKGNRVENYLDNVLICRADFDGHLALIEAVRHSTIEVHPEVSEAPHLKSSLPHPKTDFSLVSDCIPTILPWPKDTKTSFFETRLAFRLLWVKEPRRSETN